MARYLFGGSTADYIVFGGDEVTVGDVTGKMLLLVPGDEVTLWNQPAGGTQYTSVQDLTGSDVAGGVLTADSNGDIPQFRGPDGVTLLYADAGGTRKAMPALDLGQDVASLVARVAALEAAVTVLNVKANYAQYVIRQDPGTGAYPAVPSELASVTFLMFTGPNTPTTARTKDLHTDTLE